MDTIFFDGISISGYLIMLGASAFGFVVHVLFKAGEMRDKNEDFTLRKDYFGRNPYRSLGKFLSVLAAGIFMASPDLTIALVAGAVGLGYSADSAFNSRKGIS